MGKAFLGLPVSEDVCAGEDFDAYVNASWKDSHPIPGDQSTWGVLHELSDRVLDNCRSIVLGDGAPAPVGALAHSFSNAEKRDAAGVAPVRAFLDAARALETGTANVLALAARYHSAGIGAVVFSFGAEGDAKESNMNRPSFYEGGGLGLPDRDYYLEDSKAKILEKYREFIRDVFSLCSLGDGIDAAEAADLIVALETDLARPQWTKAEKRDPVKTYNRREASDSADPLAFLVSGFLRLYSPGAATGRYLVDHPEWFTGPLVALADDPARLQAWRCFFEFHAVRCLAPYLTTQLDELNFNFYGKAMQGQEEQKPEWKRIVLLCNSYLRDVVGREYSARHFTAKAKAQIFEMVTHAIEVFKDNIRTLDWMSDETKAKAMAKIEAMGIKVGFPDKWEEYPGLDMNRDAALAENMLQLMRIREDRDAARMNSPIDPTRWYMPCQLVNACFIPTRNEICFPAAILQSPLFIYDDATGKLDVPVSFGAIMCVAEHEISHAVDDSGRRYDINGELNDWWVPEDEERFKARLDLIVEQFDNYEVDVTLDDAADGAERKIAKVNGKLCAGENIADLGGVNVAFKAMQSYMAKHGRPADEEGWSPEQRFFLAWARTWATNIRPARAEQLITIDPHSPAHWRVNGPLSVLPQFHEHFGIKDGDKMFVPENKRPVIW